MLDPAELLRTSKLLLEPAAGAPASDGQLRRAVSTAYYALFHTLLKAAAERFMGAGSAGRPGYAILYRGFSHGRMKSVCQAVDVAQLSAHLSRQLGRSAIDRSLRDCASGFVALQLARHQADYDPLARFDLAYATDIVDLATLAIDAFASAPVEERADLLALMLSTSRE